MIITIYKHIRNIIFSIFILISLYSTQLYEGSSIVYLTYCMTLIVTLFFLTSKDASYFEIFFSCYLFLGFWFKYVFSLIFYNGKVYDSGVPESKSIDDILIFGILISLTCLSSHIIFKKLKKKLLTKTKTLENTFFINLYLNYRSIILIIFLILIISVALINVNLGIYQRGFIHGNDLPIILINLIKWLLIFGFTTFSCFILHLEIIKLRKVNILTFFIALFEIFASYTSLLSRSFIINSSSILLPSYQQSLKLIKKIDLKFTIFFIVMMILTIISIFEVNKIRIKKLEIVNLEYQKMIQEESKKKTNKEQFENSIEKNNKSLDKRISSQNTENLKSKNTSNKMTGFILVNRWIGIESLILVSNSNNQSFNVFFKAFNEKKNNKTNTFYEKEFGLMVVKTNNVVTKDVYLKGNTLPGIISFLYYTGNIPFVLISLFLIFMTFNFLEIFLRNLTSSNLIFVCFISNMIATRLFHFGYAPKDSYLFFGSILLSIIFMTLLQRLNFRFFR